MNNKIAILPSTSSYGGVSTYCISLCIGLKQRKVDVYLIVPLEKRFSNLWIYEKAKENNIKTIEYNLDTNNKILLGIKLLKILKDNDIRIIHTNSYRFNIISRVSIIFGLFNLYKLKHIVTIHGINPYRLVPWKIILYQTTDYIFSFMDSYTITVSNCTRDIFLKRTLVSSSKVKTIYNSIHSNNYSRDINNINIIENEIINIVFIGRLSIEKGIDFLIQIIKNYNSSGRYLSKVIFNIYGDGDFQDQIIELEKKYPSIVKYHGFIDNPNLALQNASIFILTSIVETFGLVILEAMSNGVPIIATCVGGIPEVINDDNNGLLIDYGNVNGFIRAIDNLIEDKILKDKLVKNGYFTLENKFGFDKFIDSYLSLLSSITQ